MTKFHIEYNTNNSGGSWWLSDEDWRALEAGGWWVHWAKDQRDARYLDKGKERYMGALATSACRDVELDPGTEFDAEAIAISNFEELASQNYDDRGCSCCGSPHHISVTSEDNCYHTLITGEPD